MIELNNIEKHYDLGEMQVKALDGISLTINRGDFVAVMGPSGSGKSTLMNIVGLLDKATSGIYKLEGYEIHDLPDKEQARIRNQHFGFIFQSFNLFPELNALENVMLPMGYAGVGQAERKNRAGELLEQVGLSHRLYHYPTMLSGGEQQRVAIARALSNRPDLIIADEPTGNLPTDKGREILDTLINLNREGVTIMMVTHNDDQGALAQRRIHIRDGKMAPNREGAMA
ncbi:MAG: ABC transporter ATP-binding protein [Spirochaetales bacterium]|nr:ABC transporter ATP-binding protein [Spirochaetales bacterium]